MTGYGRAGVDEAAQRFEDRAAPTSIDRALDLLTSSGPAVHTDFVRERALLCAAGAHARVGAPRPEGGPA